MTDRTDARQHDRTTTRTRPTETMTDTNTTETERRTTDGTEYRPTLQDLSHTNPYTGDVFGDTQTYGRGKAVAADGGEANIESRPSSEAGASDGGEANVESRPSSEAGASDGRERDAVDGVTDDEEIRDVEEETMEDVAHEPPGDADGAQAAYDRGAGDE